MLADSGLFDVEQLLHSVGADLLRLKQLAFIGNPSTRQGEKRRRLGGLSLSHEAALKHVEANGTSTVCTWAADSFRTRPF